MKKMITLCLVLAMVLSMAACGNQNNVSPTEPDAAPEEVPGSALEILENIWNGYAEDDKFAIMGGNPESMNMEGPGVWDPAYAEGMTYSLLIPEEQMASVAEAAS